MEGFLRTLAPQKSISLYEDQEEKIKELGTLLRKKVSRTDVIRNGVDLMLKQFEEQGYFNKKNTKVKAGTIK
jgi:hypothetical protein